MKSAKLFITLAILSGFLALPGCKIFERYSPVFDSPQSGAHVSAPTINLLGHLVYHLTAEEVKKQNEAKQAGKPISITLSGDVYVNGIKAQRNGLIWSIQNFALTAGTNVLHAHYSEAPDNLDQKITVYGDFGNQPPVAAFTTTPSSGIAPLTVQFDASASSDSTGTITEYDWDFGDGQTATGKQTSHIFQTIGTYTVQLTVKDNQNLNATTTHLVSVTKPENQLPIAKIAASPTSGLAPLTVDFDGTLSSDSDGQIAHYLWNFGDGQASSDAKTSHTYTQGGSFTATLTVTDNDGGMASATIAINVTADTTAPTLSIDIPDGSTIHTSTPLLTVSYSDELSGVDPNTLAIFVDGTDVTDHVAVGDDSALLQFTEDFPLSNGPHEISVRIADHSGNIAQTTSRFTVDLGQISTGYLVGQVTDVDGNPIEGVTITSIQAPVGENLMGTTDASGNYRIAFTIGGQYTLQAVKTGWTSGLQTVDTTNGRDSAIETMHLMQADTKVTTVTPSGGAASNSSGTIAIQIPAGALINNTPISFTEASTGSGLQIPLPNLSQFTYAMDNQPSGTVFTTPATMTIQNTLGFAPGTTIPYGIINDQLGVWTDSGHVGTVSADGQTVTFPADHFSQYDVNYPLFLTADQAIPAPSGDNSNAQSGAGAEPCLTCGSRISNASGSLGIDYALPSVTRTNQNYTLTFSYQSLSAKPSVILGSVNSNTNLENALPDQVVAKFKIGDALTEKTYPADANVKPSLIRTNIDAKNADGTTLPTGSYPYTVELGAVYSNVDYANADYFGGPATTDTGVKSREPVSLLDSVNGRVVVQNEIESPFGAGWTLNGLEKLSFDPDGTVAWSDGTGSIKVFTPIGKKGTAMASLQSIKIKGTISQIIVHQGFLYATSCESHEVYRIAQNGTVQTLIDQKANLGCPIAVAPSRRGGLYIADRDQRQILYRAPSGALSVIAGGQGKHAIAAPTFLMEDSVLALHFIAGNQIYTISPHDGKILKMAGSGNAFIRTKLKSPAAFDLDSYGNFIVLDSENNQVLKLYPMNGQVRVLLDEKSGLDHPVSFTYDPTLKRYFILEKSGRTLAWEGPGYTRLVPLAQGASGFEMARTHSPDQNSQDQKGVVGVRPTAIAYSPEVGLISANQTGLMMKTLDLKRDFNHDSSHDSSALLTDVSYISPAGEFSTLTQLSDGSFKRTLVGGDSITYLPNGLIASRNFLDGRTIQYQYDSANHLTQITLPDGSFYALTYDARGYLNSVTDPANRTTRFAISNTGQLQQIEAPDESTRSFGYTTDNLLTAQTDEAGQTTAYQYTNGRLTDEVYPGNRNRAVASSALDDLDSALNPQQNASSFTSPEGRTSSIGLDSFGLEANRTDAVGNIAYRQRNAEGQTTQQISFTGKSSGASYDQLGRVTETGGASGTYQYQYDPTTQKVSGIVDPLAGIYQAMYTYNSQGLVSMFMNAFVLDKTYYTYYPAGELKTVTDPLNYVTTYEIDTHGNTSAKVDALSSRTEYTHDDAGNITSIKDPDGDTTHIQYDAMNRPIQTQDGLGNQTSLSYTATGQLAQVTDAKHHSTRYSYNDQNLISSVQNASGQAETYEYDNDGNFLKKITLSGQPIQYTLDADNRITQKVTPEQTIQYQYDADGLPTQVSNPSSTLTRTYNELGLVRTETQSFLNGQIRYEYDHQGKRTQMTVTQNGSVVATQTYTYAEPRNLVSGMTLSMGKHQWTYSAGYDEKSRLTYEVWPNGMESGYSYDELSRMNYIDNNNAAGTVISIFANKYSHDGDLTQTDETQESQYGIQHKEFTYDANHQVVDVTGTESDTFTYDAVGNRTDHSASYNELNELTGDSDNTYQYDLDGNLTFIKKKDGSKETDLTWSSDGLLLGLSYKENGSTVKTITYQYDGLNRRIEKNLVDLVDSSKSQVRRYVYDGNNILLETDGDGKIVAYYFHSLEVDHPVAMLRDLDHSGSFSNNEVFSFTHDHLGSIRELVNSDGKVVQRYRYSTFGKTTVEKADASTDHQLVENIFAYTGREYDSDTQFYGYRNRHYSPEMGRFISQDPLQLKSHDWNLYRYGHNNPLKNIDPYGLDDFAFEMGFSAVPEYYQPTFQAELEGDAEALGYFYDGIGYTAIGAAAIGAAPGIATAATYACLTNPEACASIGTSLVGAGISGFTNSDLPYEPAYNLTTGLIDQFGGPAIGAACGK